MAAARKPRYETELIDVKVEPIEMVDHPQHYNEHPAGIECITVVEEMSFNIGNAIKYLWRAGLKPDTDSDQDLRKSIWYIERERDRLAQQ
jgi:hypothetical protein